MEKGVAWTATDVLSTLVAELARTSFRHRFGVGCLRLDEPYDSEPCLTLEHLFDTSVGRTVITASTGGGNNGHKTK